MSKLNELLVLANISLLLPEWEQPPLLMLLGICIAVKLVRVFLKDLATPPIRPLLKWLKEISGQGLQRAARSLDLPVEYPRVALVAPAIDA